MSYLDLRAAVRKRADAVARYLSRAYVAGPELGDALAVAGRFAARGFNIAVGYFNAADLPAHEIADANMAIVASLAESSFDSYAAIKAPPMHFDAALIGRIARRSGATGIGLHFDSHAIEAADDTFAAIEAALPLAARIGCTLPGRWARSVPDAERAVELKLRVRVVKGQWPDPSHPDADACGGCLRIVDRLAGRALSVAVATHDTGLAHRALSRLLDAGTPCELELLFGLPMRAAAALARGMGVPVRVYVPFGTAWLPYALSRLAARPRMLLWLLKDVVAAGVGTFVIPK